MELTPIGARGSARYKKIVADRRGIVRGVWTGGATDDLEDLTEQQKAEIEEFFETYKNLEEGKQTETLGWEGKQAAYDAIEHSQDLYEEHFG